PQLLRRAGRRPRFQEGTHRRWVASQRRRLPRHGATGRESHRRGPPKMKGISMRETRSILAFLLLAPAAFAQFGRGGGDWMTTGGDAQRSSWVRTDPKISRAAIEKGGFALAWKIKLADAPDQAMTLERYIGYRGFRSLAFMGSASGNVVAVDTDLGRIEWQKKLGTAPVSITRPTAAGIPSAPAPGRGGNARSTGA